MVLPEELQADNPLSSTYPRRPLRAFPVGPGGPECRWPSTHHTSIAVLKIEERVGRVVEVGMERMIDKFSLGQIEFTSKCYRQNKTRPDPYVVYRYGIPVELIYRQQNKGPATTR